MDTKECITRIERAVRGAVLESKPFGRSGAVSVWLEAKSVARVAEFLRAESGWGMDCLENLSVMDMKGALVLTYFVRASRGGGEALVLRASVVPEKPEAIVEVPSVSGVWPMAQPFEREAADLFGIRFIRGAPFGEASGASSSERELLPKDWVGFPLRKTYSFPVEFRGIEHQRGKGASTQ